MYAHDTIDSQWSPVHTMVGLLAAHFGQRFQKIRRPPQGSVLEPRARSARSPVCLFVVEHLPAVEHNAGVPWCADAVYSECMKHTRDMLIRYTCSIYRAFLSSLPRGALCNLYCSSLLYCLQ